MIDLIKLHMVFFCYTKYTLIIWIHCTLFLFSQSDKEGFLLDSASTIFLDEVVLESHYVNVGDQINFLVLKRKVLKVYPYIDSLKSIVFVVDDSLNNIKKKRHSRKYIKRMQKELLRQFGDRMTQLTRSEGVILSKLIYREFNLTAYDLIAKYRGSLHSFFWQRVSKLFDGNLKVEFHPHKNAEDFFINHIVEKNH